MARFLLFMYPVISDEEYAAGPSLEDVEAMNKFNQALSDAGALLGADGLAPEYTRVSEGGVTDGPFSEAKELVGGYWIIQAKDQAEAVEWTKRIPLSGQSFVEVRRIYEMEDFSEDIAAAAEIK
ncbi:YciI family protein [Solirubrobacter phytolaccae]|uniref:YciI family protein n=1 Tax=Solirubrobacter phytolaccae TaxID=1404360 RepID=A0A9X3SH55_9ACTN|nr:YciI family protein [Solirubrobacter phytolaccae]MDA0183062.1 YciI family protein [Solirubrobacter phytolaccae]